MELGKVNIKILGTRGEIEESSPKHEKHSGILIDDVLFDCGESSYVKLKPKAIYLTHLHPDHSAGVEATAEIPVYSLERPDVRAVTWHQLYPTTEYGLKGEMTILPIPTTHSKKVKSCAFFILRRGKRILYTGDMIWINKKYHDYIDNLDLVITEGSSFDKDLIRRDKKTGEIYGHSSIKKLVDLFKSLKAKKIIITHYGKWLVENPEEGYKKIKELGNGIEVIPAKDGMEIEELSEELHPPLESPDVSPITKPVIEEEPKVGLYLKEPHGRYIWENKKTLLVKSIKFTENIGEKAYLISDKLCYGIITLRESKQITLEDFNKLRDKHLITEKEFEDWNWKDKDLFAYEFTFLAWRPPRSVRIPQGIQNWIKAGNIKFLNTNEMSLEELEYYHSYYHTCSELFSPCCKEHYKIANEMLDRGYVHLSRTACDRVVELIRNLEDYNPSKIQDDNVLRDDWRIMLAWWNRIIEKKPFKYSKELIYKKAIELAKEMNRRGFAFCKPEHYKPAAKDLFEKIIKEIGEDKFNWLEKCTEELVKLTRWFDTENQIRYQVKEPPPKDYVCGQKEIQSGVYFLVCRKGDNPSEVYSVRFSKDKGWNKEKAIQWIKDHKESLSELFILPEGKGIEDIDEEYANSLDPKELISLYKYIHEEAKKGINEPLQNANIFIGTAMKRKNIYWENRIEDELTKITEIEIEEYPPGELSELEEKEEELSIEDLYDSAPPSIVIPGQPYGIYFTGRASNTGKLPKGHDWDWVFRQFPDRRIIEAIYRINPKWLSKIIHPVFDPSGPLIGHSYPGYRYGFFKVPKEEFIKGFGPYRNVQSLMNLSSIKPGMRFRLLKQASGWNKNEFWRYQDFYDIWASKYLDKGILASKKYDGRAFSIHKEGTKVWIVTEDEMRERQDQFPNVVKEIQKIKHDFIIHTEAVGYNTEGKEVKSARIKEQACEEIPREDTASYTIGDTPKEWEDRVVFHAHDLMYLDDKDITNNPYEERFNQLIKLIPETLQYLRVVEHSPKLTTPALLKRWTNKLRIMKGSEGVFYRVADATYPVRTKGDNRSPLLAKIKNLKSIDAMVWSATPKREKETGKIIPTYMYDSYILIPKEEAKHWRKSDIEEWEGKTYCRIGKTYGRKLVPKRGDIIEVLVGRIREYEEKGIHWISWMFPNFRELRKDKTEPDTLETARKLAKVGPGFIEKLSEPILEFRLKLCPFWNIKQICPLKMRFGRPRYNELTIMKKEYLQFPIACILANMFKCRFIKSYYYGFKIFRRKKL